MDSIQSNGQFVHFDTWEIGNLKGVGVQQQKLSNENDSIVFIILRKDCGGEYYYSWEDAFIFQRELPSLYEAVNTIKSNLDRKTDHNESMSIYSTKDKVWVSGFSFVLQNLIKKTFNKGLSNAIRENRNNRSRKHSVHGVLPKRTPTIRAVMECENVSEFQSAIVTAYNIKQEQRNDH